MTQSGKSENPQTTDSQSEPTVWIYRSTDSVVVRAQHYSQVINSADALSLVGIFEEPELALQVWIELQVLLGESPYQLSRFGQSVLLSLERNGTFDQALELFKRHARQILMDDPGYEKRIVVDLWAEAPDADQAAQFADIFKLYLTCNHQNLYPRPPWLDIDVSLEQQQEQDNARYTYRKCRACYPDMGYYSTIFCALLNLITALVCTYISLLIRKDFLGKQNQLIGNIEDFFSQGRKKLEKNTAILLASDDPKIDPKTVQLFLDLEQEQRNTTHIQRSPLDYGLATGVALELGKRLGQLQLKDGRPLPAERRVSVSTGNIAREYAVVQFDWFVFDETHDGFLSLVQYLRDRKFRIIKYRFLDFDNAIP